MHKFREKELIDSRPIVGKSMGTEASTFAKVSFRKFIEAFNALILSSPLQVLTHGQKVRREKVRV